MNERRDVELVRELLNDPEKFSLEGRSYDLLQEFFLGSSIETLRPLLIHNNAYVRRSAVFVASELGKVSCPLIADIVPLVSDSDLRTSWWALESVMACSEARHEYFIRVVQELENPNASMCQLALFLVSNASLAQLACGLEGVEALSTNKLAHARGMKVLLELCPSHGAIVAGLLTGEGELLLKYGAIAAKRLFNELPELLQLAAQSPNEIVSGFARDTIEREKNR